MKTERMACSDTVCGPLREASLRIPFSERLSPECQTVMRAYQPKGPDAAAARLLRRKWHRVSKCAAERGSFGSASANNPVVVQSGNAPPFMMCNIPKVGCTNFRKLLRVLMLHPDPLPTGATEQMWPAHVGTYPTLWQYSHTHAAFTDKYPAFILGRSPCAAPHASPSCLGSPAQCLRRENQMELRVCNTTSANLLHVAHSAGHAACWVCTMLCATCCAH